MYCRSCYYDLRGQETARCPECGRAFDPDDPSSFLDRPGRAHRAWTNLKEYRRPAAASLTGAWLAWIIRVLPAFHSRGAPHYFHAGIQSLVNIKSITMQRIIWQHSKPAILNFDRQVAVRELPSAFSPWTEATKLKWRRRLSRLLGAAPKYTVPTMIYALLILPLVRRWRRYVAVAVFSLCLVLHYASLNRNATLEFLMPGGYAYLDDYVYISDVDFTSANSRRHTTIAAYDLRSFEGRQGGMVAFADGHVETLEDDRARALFESQGLKYPGPKNAHRSK